MQKKEHKQHLIYNKSLLTQIFFYEILFGGKYSVHICFGNLLKSVVKIHNGKILVLVQQCSNRKHIGIFFCQHLNYWWNFKWFIKWLPYFDLGLYGLKTYYLDKKAGQ